MRSPEYKYYKHHGIITDLPPEEVPPFAWTNGSNFQFQDTATRRVGGYENFGGAPTVPPLFAMSITKGQNSYWIYCGVDRVFVTDGLVHTELTPTAGLLDADPGAWTGTILNGIPILNNQKDPPIYWDLNLSNKMQNLPGWPTGALCRAMRAFKYHLIALNVTVNSVNYPDSLWWSVGAEPGQIPATWTPAPDNDAGDLTLADSPGAIVDGLPMRDTFVVYKDYSTYSLSYVAGQYVFTQRKNFLTAGIQSPNCVAEINGNHWVFTGTDILRHDGQAFDSIIQGKVKTELVNSVDPERIELCCVALRQRQNQIWVCIPEQNKLWLSKAYVINIDTLEVGIRQLPLVSYVGRGIVKISGALISWDSDNDGWQSDSTFWNEQTYSPQDDSLLMTDYTEPALWAVDTSTLNNGAQVYAFVERLSLPLDALDTIRRRLILRVLPRIEAADGTVISIRVGSQAYFGQAISWTTPQDFIVGQSVGVDCMVDGRLLSIRFEGTTTEIWKIHSYKLEYVTEGLY